MSSECYEIIIKYILLFSIAFSHYLEGFSFFQRFTCNTMGSAWWDWILFWWLTNYFPLVFWCCWLGLLTCKTVSWIVSVETLSPTLSYPTWRHLHKFITSQTASSILAVDNCRDSWRDWQSAAHGGITGWVVSESAWARHSLHTTVIGHVAFLIWHLRRRASCRVATPLGPSFQFTSNKTLLKNVPLTTRIVKLPVTFWTYFIWSFGAVCSPLSSIFRVVVSYIDQYWSLYNTRMCIPYVY